MCSVYDVTKINQRFSVPDNKEGTCDYHYFIVLLLL